MHVTTQMPYFAVFLRTSAVSDASGSPNINTPIIPLSWSSKPNSSEGEDSSAFVGTKLEQTT